MAKYRCIIERTYDVEADSEEEAQREAANELALELLEGKDEFIVWQIESYLS